MNNLKIGVVILSRYSSSRLPGKALLKIKNKEILCYIQERLLRLFDKNDIVVATSLEESDDMIVKYLQKNKAQYYRGDLKNVSKRFYEAAKLNEWDYVVRINGDNIFVDTNVLDKMLKIAAENRYDFISNVKGRTYPKGMSIEIVKVSFYKNFLNRIFDSSFHSEHVTSFFYQNEGLGNFYYYYNTSCPEAAGIQLALDTVEDLELIKNIIGKFDKPHWRYNIDEILPILKGIENESRF